MALAGQAGGEEAQDTWLDLGQVAVPDAADGHDEPHHQSHRGREAKRAVGVVCIMSRRSLQIRIYKTFMP